MSEPRYARDMTRVMRHKGKLWNLTDDFSLASVGGVSLQAGFVSLGIGVVAGGVITVSRMMLMNGTFLLPFMISTGVITLILYLVVSRNRGGKEQPVDQFKIWFFSRLKDPGVVRGAARDEQPHRLRWVAIVWRPDWANVDVTKQPTVRKYNPQPIGDASFIAAPRRSAVTFEDLLSASTATNRRR